MVDYHTALIVGMAVLRPLCFALFLVAKCLVLLRLVEITAPGSKRAISLRITCIVSVIASNLVTLVAAGLFGSTDAYYLRAYQNAQGVIKALDQQLCIDSFGRFNHSSASCLSTLISDVLPVLNELKARQRDSVEYATLHYGSQASGRGCDCGNCFCKCGCVHVAVEVIVLFYFACISLSVTLWLMRRCAPSSSSSLGSSGAWSIANCTQHSASLSRAPNNFCMWLRHIIKASRLSGDDLVRDNPSMYYLAKSLGSMGAHYNSNLERQRQVMLSSLFIGFTFSIRAALTAVLAVGSSDSNSYFAVLPDLNASTHQVGGSHHSF
jgi:hypothetical protein